MLVSKILISKNSIIPIGSIEAINITTLKVGGIRVSIYTKNIRISIDTDLLVVSDMYEQVKDKILDSIGRFFNSNSSRLNIYELTKEVIENVYKEHDIPCDCNLKEILMERY